MTALEGKGYVVLLLHFRVEEEVGVRAERMEERAGERIVTMIEWTIDKPAVIWRAPLPDCYSLFSLYLPCRQFSLERA